MPFTLEGIRQRQPQPPNKRLSTSGQPAAGRCLGRISTVRRRRQGESALRALGQTLSTWRPVLPRVLLYERDPLLARILVDVFAYEQVDVVECGSLADIDRALAEHAGAVVVTDPWTDYREVRLSEDERHNINLLRQRAQVVVTTTGAWARKASELDRIPGVKVISKPYDLDELIDAVRAADSSVHVLGPNFPNAVGN